MAVVNHRVASLRLENRPSDTIPYFLVGKYKPEKKALLSLWVGKTFSCGRLMRRLTVTPPDHLHSATEEGEAVTTEAAAARSARPQCGRSYGPP